jgi:large subunit ribosomal protein L13
MERRWHVLDAKGRPLGRLASEAAQLLMGKHKTTYEPHLAMGDFVVVVNAREVGITGSKATQKVYYRHSGYPGGLSERTLQEQLDRDPRRVVERAVKGMLPSTALGRELFRHLKVYAGPNHPHQAQVRAGTGKSAGATAGGSAPRTRRQAAAVAEAPPDAPAEQASEQQSPATE